MIYKRHMIFLAIRLIIILGVMMTIPLVYVYSGAERVLFTYLVIAIVLVLLVAELWVFLIRTIRELTRFLEHIRNRDFNLSFNEQGAGKGKRELYRSFNEVIRTLREIRIEREAQFSFLEHIVELVQVGIIVFDAKYDIVLINSTAENLTSTTSPSNLARIVKKIPELETALESLGDGGQTLIESSGSDRPSRLAVQVMSTTVLDQPYTLMTMQDVRSVVEQKETLAWLRLMRVLNHEIKNSVTPVTSLADTILMILQAEGEGHKKPGEVTEDNLSDIVSSVKTIQQRGVELKAFIDAYHTMTGIPIPKPDIISCRDLLRESAELITSLTEKEGISLVIEEPGPDLVIRVDQGLIRQVLLNLVSNAIDALHGHREPEIRLFCRPDRQKILVCVKDNGPGIDETLREEIFVPFFTTKKGGSGIGLSFSRQVMRLHGGNISMVSGPGEGTMVCLEFVALHGTRGQGILNPEP